MRFAGLEPTFIPDAERLWKYAVAAGLEPRLTSTYRNRRTQARMYRQWLRGDWPLPVAPPGTSVHQYGLAMDLVSRDNAHLGSIWEKMGHTWGGSGDPVHFEA